MYTSLAKSTSMQAVAVLAMFWLAGCPDDEPTPQLGVSPTSVDFSATEGSNPAPRTITITNPTMETIDWIADVSRPWFTLDVDEGSLSAGSSVTITASAESSGLAVGSHVCAITVIQPSGASTKVSVSFTVTPSEEAKPMSDLKINFAIHAEQVVSARESDRPRCPLMGGDETIPFETKLTYLDTAEVSAFWLYGFRAAEGTMRDIGLLTEARRKLEQLGKEAFIVCEPVGHPCGAPPADSPLFRSPPGTGWRYRVNAGGGFDYGCADIEANLVRDLVAATKSFRDAGFKKVFFDDDLRLGNWGDAITGCFCDACIAEFNRLHRKSFTREDLRQATQDPGLYAEVCEKWMAYNCGKVTEFMKAVNLPGIQIGIMVMHNAGRKHGVDLPAILAAVPDCLVRVGEGHFNDTGFDSPAGKASLIMSLETHKAIVNDVSRTYSENTVDPWPKLRPENMAQKLLIEVEHGLRNIMLMPPPLLDAPEYWKAIADVLPKAKAIATQTPTGEATRQRSGHAE